MFLNPRSKEGQALLKAARAEARRRRARKKCRDDYQDPIYAAQKREEQNRRYKEDPAFRAAKLASAKRYYHKKRVQSPIP
jgi:hypothetical protein